MKYYCPQCNLVYENIMGDSRCPRCGASMETKPRGNRVYDGIEVSTM